MGLRLFKVATTATVASLRLETRHLDDDVMTVEDGEQSFRFDAFSLAADDGSDVIKPDDRLVTQTGRWFKRAITGFGDISVRLRRTSVLSIPTGGVGADVPWQVEDKDTDAMYPGTGTEVEVKTAGSFLAIGAVRWEDIGVGKERQLEWLVDGTPADADRYIQAAAGGNHIHKITSNLQDLTVGQKVKFRAFQNSGSPLNLEIVSGITVVMSMQKVG